MSSQAIQHVPGPWTLKATCYLFFMYLTTSDVASISRSFLFSPLEAASSFSDGKHVGGLSCIQIIRYTESPVGPYDELIIVPGKYEFQKPSKNGEALEKKQNMRITRIYVSTKESVYNGRRNWNVPKHLARFEFFDSPDGSMTVSVFPSDVPSTSPFFKASYKPMRFTPTIPASTAISKFVGLDFSQIQPPLPTGEEEELIGTDRWCAIDAVISSKKTSLGWFDLKRTGRVSNERSVLLGDRESESGSGSGSGVEEQFWPELGRWRLGVKMEDANITFGEIENWSSL